MNMNDDLSPLRDPVRGEPLAVAGNQLTSSTASYPIVDGIPRFVDPENYASDFGAQWNRFPRTQLDSYSKINLSRRRLEQCLREDLSALSGKTVLEAGSGAGRFTEILVKTGATLHSFDFSSAVDANKANNGANANLLLVQADIRHIPFPPHSYDYVICIGVLQHTPSPEQSVESLWSMVKPGGRMVIDHYRWRLRFILPTPFGSAESVYRWVTLRLPASRRARFVDAVTRFWFPLHWRFRHSLFAQRVIRRFSPVHFYYPDIALAGEEQFLEWALLDTHDAQTDVYKHLRSREQIRKLLQRLGAEEIDVRVGGNGVEATCTKPMGPDPRP